MRIEDVKPRMRVAYVPAWNGMEAGRGTVSSKNDIYVFVKFDEQVNKLGWSGATSQACDPRDLKEI